MIVIDAEKQVLGRVCSIAAKKTLLGEEVVIVNAEKAIVSGSRDNILKENLASLEIKNKGNYRKGPFHMKRADRYVRRRVRGMLPYSKARGREAFKRVQVYIGTPAEVLKKNHDIDLGKTKVLKPAESDKKLRRSITVAEICSQMGGKW
ncbi:MAG TPA: 50S ribosomal protein L13 [Candidatus Altiarchaeales archaeon]|nr:50S ribosomal protein L13 [Candidatus Altiarchaeales archaeon]